MNRPNKDNYKCLLTYTIKSQFNVGHYVDDLEKYCDELEKAIEIQSETIKSNFIYLDKALDKACECLEDGYGNEYADYKYYKDLDTSIKIPESMDYKEWKEWCLKDE